MAWWIWVAGCFVIGIVEILVPGYVFLGFAAGSLAVGLLLGAGLIGFGLPGQLALFAVISLISWFGLQRLFPRQRGEVKRWTRDIND